MRLAPRLASGPAPTSGPAYAAKFRLAATAGETASGPAGPRAPGGALARCSSNGCAQRQGQSVSMAALGREATTATWPLRGRRREEEEEQEQEQAQEQEEEQEERAEPRARAAGATEECRAPPRSGRPPGEERGPPWGAEHSLLAAAERRGCTLHSQSPPVGLRPYNSSWRCVRPGRGEEARRSTNGSREAFGRSGCFRPRLGPRAIDCPGC
ncbi:unnamed protein product [Prorocentrum cordatum]|uniref:Uncharacterized protein n=1 Tax=Prorocentrum cordatum TaxID=2364126 RepID=A0ABN9UAK8_9DINO|nr:unnamed protein product [Polarella glacialis]